MSSDDKAPAEAGPGNRDLDIEAQQNGAERAGQEAAAAAAQHDGLTHRNGTSNGAAELTPSGSTKAPGSEKPPGSDVSEEPVVVDATYREVAKHFGILGERRRAAAPALALASSLPQLQPASRAQCL